MKFKKKLIENNIIKIYLLNGMTYFIEVKGNGRSTKVYIDDCINIFKGEKNVDDDNDKYDPFDYDTLADVM